MEKSKPFRTCDVSYLTQAPTGVPGDITRADETNVEPAMMVSPFTAAYGLAAVYGSGGIAAWGTGNVAVDFAGSLARAVPSISNNISSDASFGGGIPLQTQVQNLVVRGYMSVVCQYGTPTRGGAVYVNIQAATGRVVGGFEATFQSGFNVLLTATQAEWATDGFDANLNAELRIAR